MSKFGSNLQEINIISQVEEVKEINYISIKNNFTGAKFLRECCMKLEATVVTMCTAATYYHKFFSVAKFEDYDPFLIASTCIYLASKLRNEDLKIRDIINVSYSCIHRNDPPLSLDPYFDLRDALVEGEFLVMRMLEFNLSIDLPHKHLLLFINCIKDWIGSEEFLRFPIVQQCWAILLDCYHTPIPLAHSPELIAGSIIYLVLQFYGVTIPGCKEDEEDKPWYIHLHPDINKMNVLNVSSVIMKMYDIDNQLSLKCA